MKTPRWLHRLVGLRNRETPSLLRRTLDALFRRNALKERLLRNFSISFAGSASQLVLGMLLVPVLTKNLSIADYGRIIIVGNFFSFFSHVIRVRVNDLIYRFLPSFEDQNDHKGIAALLRLSLVISVGVCAVIVLLLLVGGKWLTLTIYRDPALHALLMLQMISGALLPLEEFSLAILRLKDRFSWLVVPQTVGIATTVVLTVCLIYAFEDTNLVFIIGAVVIGQLIGILLPFVVSLKLSWKAISYPVGRFWWRVLAPHRDTMWSTIIQTNLINYLKLGARDGGIFLLGILAPPEQVALYGMAIKLTRPLDILQNNLQQALNPEIAEFYGKKQFLALHSLTRIVMIATTFFGGAVTLVVLVVAKPVILLLTTQDFLGSLPVFRLLVLARYITMISMPVFYVTLCMGELKRRNLLVALRFLFIGAFISTGLNALTLAIAQLLGALVVRIFSDIPVMRQLRSLAATEQETIAENG